MYKNISTILQPIYMVIHSINTAGMKLSLTLDSSTLQPLFVIIDILLSTFPHSQQCFLDTPLSWSQTPNIPYSEPSDHTIPLLVLSLKPFSRKPLKFHVQHTTENRQLILISH